MRYGVEVAENLPAPPTRRLREDEAAAAAVIVNQVMKMIPALEATEDERAARLVSEARKLMALYIAEVSGRRR